VRRQAERLRAWADATDKTDVNLIWLVEQQAVPVHFVPSHKLGEESGMNTDRVGGKLRMFINQHEPQLRQRFSLLHEFKHVLDFPDADTLHAKLGSGDPEAQANQIELLANEFAGQVLMPKALVRRAWFSSGNVQTVANIFNVSVEAMTTRLEKLNLVGEPRPKPRGYFRRKGLLMLNQQAETSTIAA
jgi:Zn-dependent peptidase ImmA (M78 family)